MISYKSKSELLAKHPFALNFFKKRLLRFLLITAGILALASVGARLVGFQILPIFLKLPQALTRFFKLYLPPDFSEVSKLFEQLWLTVLLAVCSATVGVILAYFSALAISKTTGKIPVLRIGIRFLATLIRNIPSAIWAITLLMAFWFGEFLAFIVMALGTYGFMTRVFSDMIDETNTNSIEALEATGASYWQIIAQAVFPETLPVAVSWALYAVESNIRSSTIIGMLAGGGVGYLIGIYKHFRKFELLFTAVIFVVITILVADQVSTQIRKRIL